MVGCSVEGEATLVRKMRLKIQYCTGIIFIWANVALAVVGEPDGGHGAVLGGVAGRHEAALGGHRGPGVLQQIQRVPTQRLSQIVSQAVLKKFPPC